MKILLIGQNSYISNKFYKAFHDVFEIAFLEREYKNAKKEQFESYDIVINFAAIVHKKNMAYHMHREINTDLPIYLASLAKEAKVKQFIQLSTVAVYGNQDHINEHTICSPDTPYGKSKLDADNSLLSMGEKSFKIAIVRPAMVYGKDAPGNMNSLMKLIATGVPLPFKYKSNKRSIIYVGNLLFLLKEIIDRKSEGVFLARDEEMPSIYDLSLNIKQALNTKNYFFPLPKMLILSLMKLKKFPISKLYGDLIVDDSKTISKLGNYRKVSYTDGLKKSCGVEI